MAGVARIILPGNADCTEFCPVPGYQSLLAAATYTLQDGPEPERLGSLHIFQVADEAFRNPLAECRMFEVCQISPSGIFDIKWRADKAGSRPLLGRASADGSLGIYDLELDTETSFGHASSIERQPSHHNESENGLTISPEIHSNDFRSDSSGAQQSSAVAGLNETTSVNCGPAMCLSLDWDTFSSSDSCQIVVSQSDGSLCVTRLTGTALVLEKEWDAHSYEAWTTAFDRWHPQVGFTKYYLS